MVYGVSDAFLDLSYLAKVTKRAVTQIKRVRDISSPSYQLTVVLGRGLFDPDPKRLLYSTRLFLRVALQLHDE